MCAVVDCKHIAHIFTVLQHIIVVKNSY